MGVAQHLHSSYGADAILCVDEQVVEMSTLVAAFAEVGETHAIECIVASAVRICGIHCGIVHLKLK